MTYTKAEIKQQEEFVQAINWQKEVAINAHYDAQDYMIKLVDKYELESNKLKQMKESN
jgi:hypothetical protein